MVGHAFEWETTARAARTLAPVPFADKRYAGTFGLRERSIAAQAGPARRGTSSQAEERRGARFAELPDLGRRALAGDAGEPDVARIVGGIAGEALLS